MDSTTFLLSGDADEEHEREQWEDEVAESQKGVKRRRAVPETGSGDEDEDELDDEDGEEGDGASNGSSDDADEKARNDSNLIEKVRVCASLLTFSR